MASRRIVHYRTIRCACQFVPDSRVGRRPASGMSAQGHGGRAGVILRGANFCGVQITLNFKNQRAEIARATCDVTVFGDRSIAEASIDSCPCRLVYSKAYHLRCFARDEHFEVYLDDRWVFTVVIGEAAKLGDVALYVELSRASFSDFKIATIKPLPC